MYFYTRNIIIKSKHIWSHRVDRGRWHWNYPLQKEFKESQKSKDRKHVQSFLSSLPTKDRQRKTIL